MMKNIYDKEKYCVKIENLYSYYCPCNIVVRQGDNLSPLYISSVYSLFSDSGGLLLHDIPSSIVLMKSIGAEFL